MIPKFFGERHRQLFGLYQAPAPADARDVGVVLCHAGPHEYRHTYFSFRRLAGLLVKAGLHVFRFDYGGTGDSAGDAADETVDAWADDVRQAARELKELSGVRRVSLVGLRLGGAVAARAVADGLRVDDLVLWEPVVDGRTYLAQLDGLEVQRLAHLRFPQSWARVPDEMVGYPLTAVQRRALEDVDVATMSLACAKRVSLVASAAVPAYERLRTALAAAAVAVSLHVVDDPAMPAGMAVAGTLLAQASLQAIVQALSNRRSA